MVERGCGCRRLQARGDGLGSALAEGKAGLLETHVVQEGLEVRRGGGGGRGSVAFALIGDGWRQRDRQRQGGCER